MAETVQCKDCGFLAYKHGQHGYIEVDRTARENGTSSNDLVESAASALWCAEGVPDISQETAEMGVKHVFGEDRKRFMAAIEKPRECSKFTPWIEGRSPREHQDMNAQLTLQAATQARLDRLHERQADAEERRHAESLAFAQRLAALEEQRHQEGRKDARSANHVALISGLIGAASAIAGGLLTYWLTSGGGP